MKQIKPLLQLYVILVPMAVFSPIRSGFFVNFCNDSPKNPKVFQKNADIYNTKQRDHNKWQKCSIYKMF